MRVALFGSPTFAVPALRALHERHEVALVVTQPDKPAGRGLRTTAPAAAAEARRLGLPVAQPERLRRDEAFRERLANLRLDVAITAAYGKILPRALLEVPRHGFLNVHASLLPRWRGAAPVQWALIEGDEETGVAIMQTEAGLDTGPVRHVRRTPIGPHELAPELFERLAALGAEALLEALELLEEGRLPCHPQDDAAATHARMLTREDGELVWSRPARASYDRYRGVHAWPGTWFSWGATTVKVRAMVPEEGRGEPGTVLAVAADGVRVAAGDGALRLETVQPAGKAPMAARDWANGYGVREGSSLA